MKKPKEKYNELPQEFSGSETKPRKWAKKLNLLNVEIIRKSTKKKLYDFETGQEYFKNHKEELLELLKRDDEFDKEKEKEKTNKINEIIKDKEILKKHIKDLAKSINKNKDSEFLFRRTYLYKSKRKK